MRFLIVKYVASRPTRQLYGHRRLLNAPVHNSSGQLFIVVNVKWISAQLGFVHVFNLVMYHNCISFSTNSNIKQYLLGQLKAAAINQEPTLQKVVTEAIGSIRFLIN